MSERTLRRLVGALAVAVLLWLAAALFSRGRGAIGASGEIVGLFEGVEPGSVGAVRIVSPPAGSLELLPRDGDWSVNGYDADSLTVARFFQALEELKVGDLVASNPANHARMGVVADSAARLEVETPNGVPTLLVGHDGARYGTAFGRLPDHDEVYLLEGDLRNHLVRRLDDWRLKRMVAVDSSRVARLEIERDGAAYGLVRGDSLWTLEGGTAADQAVVRDVLAELSGLLASGFVAEGDSLASLPRGGGTRAYDAGGGVLAEITLGSGDSERWGRVTGDDTLYRLARFRVDRLAPAVDRVPARF